MSWRRANDPATREILDKTIVILVPSANPDGVDKVAHWYERSKDKPWEGTGMPELYHHYAGHDTNRDWFMLNLKETQLLTRLLYKEWFPDGPLRRPPDGKPRRAHLRSAVS